VVTVMDVVVDVSVAQNGFFQTDNVETERLQPPKKRRRKDTSTCSNQGQQEEECNQLSNFIEGVKLGNLQHVRELRRVLSVQNPPISFVLSAGLLPYLFSFLVQPCEELKYEAAWAISNICTGTKEEVQSVVNIGCIPIFVEFLRPTIKNAYSAITEQALWALGNIAAASEFRDDILKTSAVDTILDMLSGPEGFIFISKFIHSAIRK